MKFLFGVLFFVGSLFAVSQSKATVIAVDEKIITLDKEYIKGVSGVIVHRYNDYHSAIIAAVVSLGGNKAKVVQASYVQNTRLPDIATKIQVKDVAVMGYLYNRSLLIAPNEAAYRNVLEIYPNIDFVNPDLLAFQMMRERKTMPTQKSIQEYCNQNAIGLVYIVTADMGYFIDVNSFEILNVEPIDSSGERILPFFMRLERIDGGILGLFESLFSKIKDDIFDIDRSIEQDYDRYYLYIMGSSDDN